ncbi:MAG: hypothetical protein KGI50_04015 [Patescibacteria group bacterium]|nr:hypothetical protein [Patescibacteria group bacterium]MDE2438853.1 hypothetical protein [Patescibacteria group bacterium]
MSRRNSLWEKEIGSVGIDAALLDRLRFHGALTVSGVMECTQRGRQTILKHFKRLVENRQAQWRQKGNMSTITLFKYPPISPRTPVKTTEPNMALQREWTDEGWESKKWGIRGEVITHHDSHGLCYEVRHEDGTRGYYDPSELEVILLG